MNQKLQKQSHRQIHQTRRETITNAIATFILFATIALSLVAYYLQKTMIGLEYTKGTYERFMEVLKYNNVVSDIIYICLAALVYLRWRDIWIKIISLFFILITGVMLVYNTFDTSGSTLMNLIWLASLFTAFCITGVVLIRRLYYRE